MIRLLKILVASAFAMFSLGTQASTSTLTPIGVVNILSTNYNVSLLSDLTYDLQSFSLLSPTITFTTESDATAAAAALLAQFGAGYDWNPTCTDCVDGVRVAFAVNDSTYDYMTVFGSSVFGPFNGFDLVTGNNFSFAQFTAVGAVPEPETYAMMLAGLGLLGFTARRRKQKAA